jgi:copper(I)-binding protein
MKRRSVILGIATMAALSATSLQAQQAQAPGLDISGGFLRAAPMVSRTGAGFMIIRSTGPADKLLAFRSPACTRPELHTHINDNGIMRMREVPEIDVPAGGEARLQPGGLHLMFIDLTTQLTEGEMVPVTLIFEKAGEVQIELPVKRPGAMN